MRRAKLLLIVGLVSACALIVLIAYATSAPQPQPVFRLREVHSYVMPRRPPPAVSGDRIVQADFEYVGPPLTPAPGRVRRSLDRIGLAGSPADVRWSTEDIVLLDSQGRELHRMAPDISVWPPTTRPSARAGFSEDPSKHQLVHGWTFDFPAGIDPAEPVIFRTRLGVNDHPAVLVEVKLPQIPRSRAASQPATDPVR